MVGAVKWVMGVDQARWRPGEVEVETVAGCRAVQWVSAVAVGHRRVRVAMSGGLLVVPAWQGVAIRSSGWRPDVPQTPCSAQDGPQQRVIRPKCPRVLLRNPVWEGGMDRTHGACVWGAGRKGWDQVAFISGCTAW